MLLYYLHTVVFFLGRSFPSEMKSRYHEGYVQVCMYLLTYIYIHTSTYYICTYVHDIIINPLLL
ncbi:hypothetical protein BDZ91DRAFT_265259 [Kalaharituber pfeilii]|nr:hypothetical protein BDZ91DRAFT_265259 [Kalaharituber pfeilii]